MPMPMRLGSRLFRHVVGQLALFAGLALPQPQQTRQTTPAPQKRVAVHPPKDIPGQLQLFDEQGRPAFQVWRHPKAAPVAIDLEDFHALPPDEMDARQRRLLDHANRIRRDLAGDHGSLDWSTRGIDQAVIALDIIENGQPKQFGSESAAARFVGPTYTADHVRRAIVRSGRCGGHRFAWASGRQPTVEERQRERGL